MGRQNLVAKATRKFKVTTDIAYRAGLGAHELLTLRLEKDKPADTRPKIKSKFYGRYCVRYTTTGKGGVSIQKLI